MIMPAVPSWIPDLLLPYALTVLASDSQVTVLRNNGPGAPWHLRLLAQVTGQVDPGYRVFSGSGWPSPDQRSHGLLAR
jgi:hypothetical protein